MSHYDQICNINVLVGKTLVSVTQDKNVTLDFEDSDGQKYQMYYEPDCCASAWIEDVVGDLQDLVGTPIVMAEESTNSDDPYPESDYQPDSYTWTYYKLATVKGYVTVRWFGQSNGYYCETATFRRVN